MNFWVEKSCWVAGAGGATGAGAGGATGASGRWLPVAVNPASFPAEYSTTFNCPVSSK